MMNNNYSTPPRQQHPRYQSLWIDSHDADNELRELREAIQSINIQSPTRKSHLYQNLSNVSATTSATASLTNSRAILSALKALQNRIKSLTLQNTELTLENDQKLHMQQQQFEERLQQLRANTMESSVKNVRILEKKCNGLEKELRKEKQVRMDAEQRCKELENDRLLLTNRLSEIHKTLHEELTYSAVRIAQLEEQCSHAEELKNVRQQSIDYIREAINEVKKDNRLNHRHCGSRKNKTQILLEQILKHVTNGPPSRRVSTRKKKRRSQTKHAQTNRKDFPFVAATSTAPSFSLPIRVQEIMAEEQRRSPSPLSRRRIPARTTPPALTLPLPHVDAPSTAPLKHVITSVTEEVEELKHRYRNALEASFAIDSSNDNKQVGNNMPAPIEKLDEARKLAKSITEKSKQLSILRDHEEQLYTSSNRGAG